MTVELSERAAELERVCASTPRVADLGDVAPVVVAGAVQDLELAFDLQWTACVVERAVLNDMAMPDKRNTTQNHT